MASLTTPAVSRVFLFSLSLNSSTLLRQRTNCVFFFLFCSSVSTLTCSARLRSSTRCCPPNISSITIDHDELFELPLFKGGAYHCRVSTWLRRRRSTRAIQFSLRTRPPPSRLPSDADGARIEQMFGSRVMRKVS